MEATLPAGGPPVNGPLRGHLGERKFRVGLLAVVFVALLMLPGVGLRGASRTAAPRAWEPASLGAATDAGAQLVARAESSLHSNAIIAVTSPGWRNAAPSSHPDPRSDAAEAYDPVLGEVVLFGGVNGSVYLGDTWVYYVTAVGAGFWKEVVASPSPEPRADAAIAFDVARGEVVLSGGRGTAGALNSTWAFNGGSWTNLSAGGLPALVGAEMTFDDQTGALLLFGGESGTSYPSALYQLSGTNWMPLTPTGTPPPGRGGATFVFDPARAAVLLSGGSGSSEILADTWELAGNAWSPEPASGPAPPVVGAASVMDAADGVLLVIGGNTSSGPSPYTYELPTESGWAPAPLLANLPARAGASAAFDEALGETLLFGGWDRATMNDTWLFTLATPAPSWRTLPVSGDPPRRSGAGFAYDPADGYVVLFGGLVRGAAGNGTTGDLPKAGGNPVTTGFYGDTWAFSNGTWTNITPVLSPSPRRDPMLAYDPRDGYLVLFGGSNGSAYLNDTWTFRGGRWSELHPPISPPSRRGGGLTFDGARQALVLFGGHSGSVSLTNYSFFQDLWTFTGGNWTPLHPTSSGAQNPPAEAQPSFAYDPGTGYDVLFGGYRAMNPDGTGEDSLNYTYTLQGSQWTNLSLTTSRHSPSPRDGSAFGMDDATGALVLWGGDDLAATMTDIWSFQRGAWTELCIKCAPPGGADNGGTWDPALAGLLSWGADPGPGTSTTSLFIAPFELAGVQIPPVVDLGAHVPFLAQAAGGVQPWSAAWTFHDPNGTASGWNVSHPYSAAGTFLLNLSAGDAEGATFNFSQNVSVNASLQLTLTAVPWGPNPSGARLNATVRGGAPPFRYAFDFGDGKFDNLSNERPTSLALRHQYGSGTFAPSVTVTDAGGGQATATGPALTLPATTPVLGLAENRSVIALPGAITLNSLLADPYGGTNYTWTVTGTGSGAFTTPPGPTMQFKPHSVGAVHFKLSTLDSVNLYANATVNLTVVPALLPAFNPQIPNKIACPVSAGSAPVTLNATVAGGEAPFTYTWTWGSSSRTGTGVVVGMTPGVPEVVNLTVEDAAQDNATVSRSILVPPATCGPSIGLPTVTGKLVLEIAIALIAAVVLIEAVVLIRNRNRARPPPKPADP